MWKLSARWLFSSIVPNSEEVFPGLFFWIDPESSPMALELIFFSFAKPLKNK